MSSEKRKLYILSWGLFPRRVTIYLKEKGIASDFDIVSLPTGPNGIESVPGKPPGTVPILEIGDGNYIHQSTAILEYLEDTYPQAPNMRGTTPAAAARIRDLMAISNEFCTHLSQYLGHASKIFEKMPGQSSEAAKASLDRAHMLLSQLESMADPEGPFLSDSSGQLTIADCMTLSTLQFAREVYDVDLVKDHPRMKTFVDAFEKRDSAEVQEVPEMITQVARVLSVR